MVSKAACQTLLGLEHILTLRYEKMAASLTLYRLKPVTQWVAEFEYRITKPPQDKVDLAPKL